MTQVLTRCLSQRTYVNAKNSFLFDHFEHLEARCLRKKESSFYVISDLGWDFMNVAYKLLIKDSLEKNIKGIVPHYNSYYNIYAIGLITGQLFKMVTLLGRITDIMVFFFCIVGGVFYCVVLSRRRKLTMASLTLILGILLYFVPYLVAPFSREDRDMRFLWDSNGELYDKSYM